jgi:hypothetical protein
MSDYLDFAKVRAGLNKALKRKLDETVAITLPRRQAELLLDHVKREIEKEEDRQYWDW